MSEPFRPLVLPADGINPHFGGNVTTGEIRNAILEDLSSDSHD
jgi:hypothetical protein